MEETKRAGSAGRAPETPETVPNDAMPDEDLIEKSRQGDQAAFGFLIERYQDRVFSLVFRKLGRYEEARDVTQEAFIRAWKAIPRFEGRSGFYTWVYRIAVNCSLTRGGKLTRRKAKEAYSLDAPRPGTDSSGADAADKSSDYDPVAENIRKEEANLVHKTIQLLDEKHKTMILLKDMQGLQYEEISEILDIPIGSVKSRLHRARQALKKELSKQMDIDQ